MTDLLIDLYKNEFEKYDWRKLKDLPIHLFASFIVLLVNIISLFIGGLFFTDKVILNSILILSLFIVMTFLYVMIRNHDRKYVINYIDKRKAKVNDFRSLLEVQFDIKSINQLEKLSTKLSRDLPKYLYISNFFQPIIKFGTVIIIPLLVYGYSIASKEEYADQELLLILAIILILLYFGLIVMIMRPVATSVIESKHRILSRIIDLIDDMIILDNGGHDSIR